VRTSEAPLTWKDRSGVVHAMVDDLESEKDHPFSVMALCGAGSHTLDCSRLIRLRGRQDWLTCLECVKRFTVPQNLLFVWDRDADCWNSLPHSCPCTD
jgi:hypothetical protein